MTIVVLLGAGASYGSGDAYFSNDGRSERRTPPLGSKLFNELEVWSNLFSNFPISIKDKFRSDFEAGMAAFYKDSEGDIMAFHREMAHFFALFRPGPASVYKEMVKCMGSRRVIYSSLNYDLLLEQSVESLGLVVAYSPERRDGQVSYLKPHGSANFWPNIPSGMIRGSRIYGSGGADIVAPIQPLDRQGTLRKCRTEDSIAPAIAMFAEGKPVKISPGYLQQQQKWWTKEVREAAMVFVVGVRVHPVDAHIWGVLGKTSARVTYFGQISDRPSFLAWKEASGKKAAYFELATFQESISKMRNKMKSFIG